MSTDRLRAGAIASALFSATAALAAEPAITPFVNDQFTAVSVNAIAGEATLELDMRSVAMPQLLQLETAALKAIRAAVDEENARWNHSLEISVKIDLVGDRPAGSMPVDAPIIQAAILAVRGVGVKPVLDAPSSNDSNVPIRLGIPAVTLGRGGVAGNNHALNEWYDPKDGYLGVQKNLLAVLALVGVEGVSTPVLAKAAPRR